MKVLQAVPARRHTNTPSYIGGCKSGAEKFKAFKAAGLSSGLSSGLVSLGMSWAAFRWLGWPLLGWARVLKALLRVFCICFRILLDGGLFFVLAGRLVF